MNETKVKLPKSAAALLERIKGGERISRSSPIGPGSAYYHGERRDELTGNTKCTAAANALIKSGLVVLVRNGPYDRDGWLELTETIEARKRQEARKSRIRKESEAMFAIVERLAGPWCKNPDDAAFEIEPLEAAAREIVARVESDA